MNRWVFSDHVKKGGSHMAKWIIDSDHACATFAVRHFMIANVVGLFGKITGVISFDPPEIAHLSADADIDVSSISTGNKERDEHLLSPDFLDAAKYPKIIFKTNKVEAEGNNRGKVTADLTIRGITRPILRDRMSGSGKEPIQWQVLHWL
jgi:polyisoprenoid-binding protein YceI